MTEMYLSMASSRNSAKYCECSTAVFDVHSFCRDCREKLIKSYLILSMSHDRLSNLSLISIEHETVEIDFD